MKKYFNLFLKGLGVGAANVIPGVSGGTIALITGIFEELIDSLKSFDVKAVKLLFSGRFKDFANYINLDFLIAVFAGVFVSILTFAKLLEFLFKEYPVFVWSFFFGLIVASVYYVGRTIKKLNLSVGLSFLFGTAIALTISFLTPASENDGIYYLFICGIVAVCSMIIPGLSGSFVLILMGNYQLVFIEAVNNFDFRILLPVGLGAIFGLIAFSHMLSWIFKKFREQTLALLTGFILGSLGMLWPWKREIFQLNASGEFITKPDGSFVIQGYERFLPETFSGEVVIAILLMITGIISISLLEWFAHRKSS